VANVLHACLTLVSFAGLVTNTVLGCMVARWRAGWHIVVSLLVSFGYVLRRSARTTRDGQPRWRTLLTCAERRATDLESVLETLAAHDRHRRPHKRRACGPRGTDPARCGQDGQASEPRHESTVLTDLLTTTLDHHGHGRTEKPGEQGRRDCLESRGRP
jgi:hypothetical protein